MSNWKKTGIGFGIFLGILGSLLLFLRALLPKRRGIEFYISKVGKNFYIPKVGNDFYIPKVSKDFYVPRMRKWNSHE